MDISKTELTMKIETMMADLTEEVLIKHGRLLVGEEPNALYQLKMVCEKLIKITEAESEYDEILTVYHSAKKGGS